MICHKPKILLLIAQKYKDYHKPNMIQRLKRPKIPNNQPNSPTRLETNACQKAFAATGGVNQEPLMLKVTLPDVKNIYITGAVSLKELTSANGYLHIEKTKLSIFILHK